MPDLNFRLLWHALGLSHHRGTSEPYRNHYVAGPGHHSEADLDRLEAAGLVRRRERPGFLPSSSVLFTVTDEGKAVALRTFREATPKLTRSQRRYRRYLDEDSSLSFGAWLKAGRQ